MSRDGAKHFYNPQPGDPQYGFISSADALASLDVVYDDIEAFEGTPGPQGLQGPQGATGAPGVQGIKGDRGERGYQGPAGPTGERGPKGNKGDTGEKGDPSGVWVNAEAPYDPHVPAPGSPYMWVDSDDDANYHDGSPSGVWAQPSAPDPYQAPSRATWLWVDTDEEVS